MRCTVAEDLPRVSCDPKLVHMVLMDIVINALDACAAKRYDGGDRAEVVVALQGEGNGKSVAIAVEDNGVGMSDAVGPVP